MPNYRWPCYGSFANNVLAFQVAQYPRILFDSFDSLGVLDVPVPVGHNGPASCYVKNVSIKFNVFSKSVGGN